MFTERDASGHRLAHKNMNERRVIFGRLIKSKLLICWVFYCRLLPLLLSFNPFRGAHQVRWSSVHKESTFVSSVIIAASEGNEISPIVEL